MPVEPAPENVTVSLAAVVEKLVPVMVNVAALFARLAELEVTVGAGDHIGHLHGGAAVADARNRDHRVQDAQRRGICREGVGQRGCGGRSHAAGDAGRAGPGKRHRVVGRRRREIGSV